MRSPEPLFWLGEAAMEIRRSEQYYYNCRNRMDRPHIVLQITLEGCGFYTRGPRRELLPPNTAFIDAIPGAFEYGYAAESSVPYRLAFVSMAGPVAMRWMRRIHMLFGRVLHFGEDRTVADQVTALAGQDDRGVRLDRYQSSALAYALVMQIHSVLMRSRIEQATRVRRAMAMIEQDGRDPNFGIARLAEELECSREHLTRQFHDATGISPSAYLSQHRLALAARDLRSGTEKLDVIARRCGFSGANYFCRAFRQRWGITPAQYRAAPGMMLLP